MNSSDIGSQATTYYTTVAANYEVVIDTLKSAADRHAKELGEALADADRYRSENAELKRQIAELTRQ